MMNIKQGLKSSIKLGIGRPVKLFPRLRRSLTSGLTVFVFHDITETPSRFEKEYGISASIDTFTRQISWISNNFDIIHPESLIKGTNLPKRSAMITFDDGFLGTFNNGLNILEKLKIPSIIFLNMQAIIEQRPILSAVACYLDRYVPEFSHFAKSQGILRPFLLTLTPKILCLFEERYGYTNLNEVLDYQGPFADLEIVKKWDNHNNVVYGNHLFEHWNTIALSICEFEEQYNKNKVALSQLKNSLNLFAFPNGHPGSCFSRKHVELLTHLGVQRVFYSSGGLNPDASKYLLNRISLSEPYNEDHLWFQMFKSILT
ncbi:MAG: polysaccharide deacetylase family protein [Bacteroidia bacterium]|nr:polysaccharide deacetylase family protein [Bacteroidia bacterium]